MKHGLEVIAGASGWRVKQAGWKWRSTEHYRQKETRIEKYNWWKNYYQVLNIWEPDTHIYHWNWSMIQQLHNLPVFTTVTLLLLLMSLMSWSYLKDGWWPMQSSDNWEVAITEPCMRGRIVDLSHWLASPNSHIPIGCKGCKWNQIESFRVCTLQRCIQRTECTSGKP